MIKDLLKYFWVFLILVLAQVLVLNRIHFSGFINPYLYVLFILYLPAGINRGTLMLLGFITGFIVDLFSNTPGMHAGATVLISFIRPFLLKDYLSKDSSNPESSPTIRENGIGWYIKYAGFLVLSHHTFLFMVEQFNLSFIWPVLVRIVLSSLATMILILLAQLFLIEKSGRRA